ncbi:serpin family protein [Labilibacter marinus]|uniref:serpin family protein n=1 Tax=Labilibacter marinus TaxID=1477105 RepID=UPI00094F91F8|nr:serpin family protein [Labilibacter marinus]
MRSFNVLLLAIIVLFSSCNDKVEEPNSPYVPIELSLKSKELVKSSNVFGTQIFKEVLEVEDANKNVLISPLSVFQALAMTRNGAKETTLDEMNQVLAVQDFSSDVNIYQQKLVNALLKADNKFDLDIANSIWYRDGFEVLPDFIQTNQQYYNAEVTALDFSQGEAAKKTINDWVDKQTRGKIPEIVKEVSSDHVMFLINAIYLYGEWQNSFDAKNTKSELFYSESGEEQDVKMMHQTSSLRVGGNDIFSSVEMPYGNGHFNMMVLLPNEGKKVADIVDAMTDEAWDSWMQNLVTSEVNLSFPKFKLEAEYKLKKPLMQMGMPTAFTGAADFTGINPRGGIAISQVRHKTFMEVDEKGTEAAAVTSVEIRMTSADPSPKEFVVNKPFVFAITERDTNTILFMGKMMMPQ